MTRCCDRCLHMKGFSLGFAPGRNRVKGRIQCCLRP